VRAVAVRRSGVAGRGGRLLSPFVGRARALATLQTLLAQVEAGRGQVVGVVGEPGIGKSRLLYEFARILGDTGVSYLEGHCLAYDQATPYGPVRGILRQLFGISDVDGPQAVTARLRHCLRAAGLSPEADAPYVLPLLGVPGGAMPSAEVSPEARKARTLALLRHLSLHSHEGRPRVMAVENVHWSDPSSEEYLGQVADGLSGVQLLLITTYRPGYRPAWLDKSYATQLPLSPLRPQDSHAVVRSVLPATLDSSPWEQAIVGIAGGNPFFLEELAWAVREGGVAEPTVLIPDTVQAVLAARIDRLPLMEKWLLQTAAVIGHEVPLRLLQAVAELPEEALQRGLARLQAGEFLYETRLAPDLAYMFKHALTREVAYDSLLQGRRRALHARIVEALEELAGKQAAEQVERLAHHAWQGEVWAKAVVYLRQAGAKAMAGSANREASAHFERALAALAHLPQSRTVLEQAIDVRCELRMALVPFNELGRICDILYEAEALALALDDQRRWGKVAILITHYLWSIWDLDQALPSAHRALDLALSLEDVSLQVMAYFVLGEVYYGLGDYQQAITMLRRNVAALDQAGSQGRFGEPALGPGLQVVGSLRWLIQALTNVGAFAEGLALADDTLQLAEADGHPYTLVLAHAGVGYLYLVKGEIPRAIALFDQGLELCRVWDIELTSAKLDGPLGYALALSGRIPEALSLLERTVGQSPCSSVTSRMVLNTVWVSEVYLRAGHLVEAHTVAVQALTLAREHKERGTEAWTLRLLGDIAGRRDPPEVQHGVTLYQQALALAEGLGMRPLQAHCHLGLSTLYAKTAQRELARGELMAAIALYRAMDMTFWLPQAEAALTQVR
jgi:tetratricopeptide (TPR) repeat protein